MERAAFPGASGIPSRPWLGTTAFWIGAALLFALRLGHMSEPIDGPHAWRQCDTAEMIRGFDEGGFDLAHPSVSWLGGYGTVVLEFPLPEAIVAVAYRLLAPTHRVARGVFLGFFLLATATLHAAIARQAGTCVARIATLCYLAMPLGLAYSRAIHIDFAAVALAHATYLAAERALRRDSIPALGAAVVLATAAFVVKAPYVFYLALPIAWLAHTHARGRVARRAWPLLGVPILALWLWTRHAATVNGAVPDWSAVLPEFHPMTHMWGWYFGGLRMRLRARFWLVILGRLVQEITSLPGLALLAAGIYLGRDARHRVFQLWGVGVILFVLTFFNLAFNHDYYLIPLMAPAAYFVAVAIAAMAERVTSIPRRRATIALLLLGGLAVRHVAYAERNYYERDPVREAASDIIARTTPAGDLVIVSDRDLDCRAPLYLYRAHRHGWQVRIAQLTTAAIDRLRRDGARHLAIIRPEVGDLPSNLDPRRAERHALPQHHELLLFHLTDDAARR